MSGILNLMITKKKDKVLTDRLGSFKSNISVVRQKHRFKINLNMLFFVKIHPIFAKL
jgi:hypothetical protein